MKRMVLIMLNLANIIEIHLAYDLLTLAFEDIDKCNYSLETSKLPVYSPQRLEWDSGGCGVYAFSFTVFKTSSGDRARTGKH